jgi:thiamine pyrophosphate-dependent acetolactate synthase large subunit-like protein
VKSVAETGRQAILEQFVADGFRYMFGNPGTVEQGFLDALKDHPELRYILTLQESVAVMTADGYARAARRPALVQIHSTPGLGNAIGSLYQAMRGHAPLVVIGGDAGIRYQAMDSQMAGDLVGMAKPVTKWSTMVQDASSLLRTLRRAVKIAATPPMGPVYVCLPQDILDAPCTEPVYPTSIPSTRVLPDPKLISEAAASLAAAERPVFFIGDGIAFSDAQPELTKVAELVGAEVWEADAGEVNIDYSHPLYRGMTGHMFGANSLPITSKGDVNFICGTYVLPEVFPELGEIFAPTSKVIHVDLNLYEIGKNHRVDLGLLGDPKLTLAQLAQELESRLTADQREGAKARLDALSTEREKKRKAQREADQRAADSTPIKMAQFASELAKKLPKDRVIFDEALTNSPPISEYLAPQKTATYFLTRGGSLGVGFPGAIGAKLANPDKTVIGFSGDGGAMYTIQALWTAARHNTDVKFVVCNNRSYRLLQLNIDVYWQERKIPKHDFPLSFDLSHPPIRFEQIAQSMGVKGVRVEKPSEIGPAIDEALKYKGPFLIDLVLEGDTHPDRVGNTCGQ